MTRIGIGVAALALFASCDRDTPSEPSGPPATTAPRYEVTLLTSAPPSGSTILTAECIFDFFPGSSRSICSSQPRLSFGARSDQGLADASLYLEFYTETELRCAVGFTSRFTLAPGAPTTITSEVAFLSLPPDQPQFCALPVTTTRIVAYLRDGSGTRLLTTEFAGTYTFVHPPNPPRTLPPRGDPGQD